VLGHLLKANFLAVIGAQRYPVAYIPHGLPAG
jgi:hypothetical protein